MSVLALHGDRHKAILRHASPILIAQLASISTAMVDTVVAGRFSTVDLAAVGVGNGLYISIMLAGAGIVQGLTPIAAHHYGAKRFDDLRPCFQQGIWLCLFLALCGIVALSMPDWILAANHVSPEVAERTRDYLAVVAGSLPGVLIYRTCGGMLNALGRPRMLMFFGLSNAVSHLILAPTLAFGWLGIHPLGAVGCATSMLINTSLLALGGLFYLARSAWGRDFHLFDAWQRPNLTRLKEILHLGLPIGMSTFVEMTCFALISLLVASLGANQVGANRVVSNFVGLCYMLPLSISIATLTLVGQAAGAGNTSGLRQTIKAGLQLGGGTSMVLGCLLWLLSQPIVLLYTPDPAVRSIVLQLMLIIACNQFFDAMQTIAAQALRGLKIAKGPMLVHIICFWGVGLLGGWLLCYRGLPLLGIGPQNLAGFWQASLLATMLASILFGGMLWRTIQRMKPASGQNAIHSCEKSCHLSPESGSLPAHNRGKYKILAPDTPVQRKTPDAGNEHTRG
ncbi:MATE family efflux transporter [Uliginosibacterium gangwonense]|uniref:MATE family efflux transporter n=1 Tax=Uliginosibacterium gangwonense TaxID=392736 RepID=UPI00036E7EFB|nr:MATE family efflux transporter [Uliginosibacterium gangwonense]